MKFALPLKKDVSKSYKMINQTFLQVATAVMAAIPTEIHSNLTIFCSIIECKSKIKLHATSYFALQLQISSVKIIVRRHSNGQETSPSVFVCGARRRRISETCNNIVQKLAKFSTAATSISMLRKKYFNAMRNIQHQKRLLSNGEGVFLTGLAKAEDIVEDEDTEQRLRVLAVESYQLFRNCRNAIFQACAFSMLEYPNCRAANLQFCHHPSRCNIIFDNQGEEKECETNIAEKNNADYVMETSGKGKHGIMENNQETVLSNESSPATSAEEIAKQFRRRK